MTTSLSTAELLALRKLCDALKNLGTVWEQEHEDGVGARVVEEALEAEKVFGGPGKEDLKGLGLGGR